MKSRATVLALRINGVDPSQENGQESRTALLELVRKAHAQHIRPALVELVVNEIDESFHQVPSSKSLRLQIFFSIIPQLQKKCEF